MTLKEKVKEMQPECVNDVYGGGVHGCPANYPYLNKPKLICYNTSYEDCEACWNQPFVGKAVEPVSLGSDINVITETEGVALVIHARWVRVDDVKCRCSNCETIYCIYSYPYKRNNYCPNCGAKMLED